jgi:hypothetical protein
MTRAGTGLGVDAAIVAMSEAYAELLQDPELLQVQLHGFAAAPGDPDIAATCRRTFEVLWHLVHERTDLSDDEIRHFFSMGMMMNVMSAIDLLSVNEHWAQSFCPTPGKLTAIRAASQAIKDQRIAELVPTEEVPA